VPREYDKLVRDRIPEVIEENGERPVVHRVDGAEYHGRLVDKLEEEVAEYREDESVEERFRGEHVGTHPVVR
jgi:predicted house-cleaning noncanonical NTP pyrophosphatase (MazG superfamily)